MSTVYKFGRYLSIDWYIFGTKNTNTEDLKHKILEIKSEVQLDVSHGWGVAFALFSCTFQIPFHTDTVVEWLGTVVRFLHSCVLGKAGFWLCSTLPWLPSTHSKNVKNVLGYMCALVLLQPQLTYTTRVIQTT